MPVKNHETYLGEILSTSGSNDKNIQNKRSSGLSAVSQNISMLNQISLGHFFFEIALVLTLSNPTSERGLLSRGGGPQGPPLEINKGASGEQDT